MILGLDSAGGRPSGQSIAQAGYRFVVRYLSDGGTRLPGKQLVPSEADDLRSNGVDVVACWETYANRAREGSAAGTAPRNRGAAASENGAADGTRSAQAKSVKKPERPRPTQKAPGAEAERGGQGANAPATGVGELVASV